MSLKKLKVLLVEDEAVIRMMVADMLRQLGHTIAAETAHIDQAVEFARSAEFDLAVLDVNLSGRIITPAAELIKVRGRPIILATGYSSEGMPERFRDLPALKKPFRLETLAALIDEVMWPRAL